MSPIDVTQLVADIERTKNQVKMLLEAQQQTYDKYISDAQETKEEYETRMSISALKHSINGLDGAARQLLVFAAQSFKS